MVGLSIGGSQSTGVLSVRRGDQHRARVERQAARVGFQRGRRAQARQRPVRTTVGTSAARAVRFSRGAARLATPPIGCVAQRVGQSPRDDLPPQSR